MLASLTLLLVLSLLAISLYALHKVRRVHLMLYQMQDRSRHELNAFFRQIETLHGLYMDLGLRKSLPPTRGFAGSPDFLRELVQHAMRKKPLTVVECSSGVSTVVLARCMQLNGMGKVYSLEHDWQFAQKTRKDLERQGLSEWATVLDAPLVPHRIKGETWPWYEERCLPQDIRIDMLIIDGPPMSTRSLARYPAGPVLFPLLADDAAVFLDDAAREDENAILGLWRSEFPELQQASLYCEKGCALLQKEVPR